MGPDRTSVLVVDDSPVVRQVLSQMLAADAAFGDVTTAPSGALAMRKIHKLDPDVVTLDVEMPYQDGLTTLEQIMAESPRPVIMVSAHTQEGASKTIRALELGAVDFVSKPTGKLARHIAAIGEELKGKIKAVSQLKKKWQRRAARRPSKPITAGGSRPDRKTSGEVEIVAIGASTGGTDAIRRVLTSLPADFPAGLVVVQHMPAGFTASFAARLNELCALEVKEASNRDLIKPGRALLAPGHSHLIVRREELGAFVELSTAPEVSGHRPSVDVLFESVAEIYGAKAVGVLLTGMGRDGAMGMRQLHRRRAVTIAQNAESCVVFGMPKAAIEEGSASLVAPLSQIGRSVRRAIEGTLESQKISTRRPA